MIDPSIAAAILSTVGAWAWDAVGKSAAARLRGLALRAPSSARNVMSATTGNSAASSETRSTPTSLPTNS